MTSLPLILLPGLGTDERLFAMQRTAFPEIIVPPWLTPGMRETIPQYAARMAAAVNPGGPCLVGGMSFGGVIALEMTRHLDARGCLLISTIRSAAELPPWARWLGPWAWLLPPRTDLLLAFTGTALLYTIGRVLPRSGRQFCTHLSKTRCSILPWACRTLVKWRPLGDWPCPVQHLHGDSDPILSHQRTQPTQLVPHAGHVLPLTHPFVVNRFLQDALTSLSQPEAQAPGLLE